MALEAVSEGRTRLDTREHFTQYSPRGGPSHKAAQKSLPFSSLLCYTDAEEIYLLGEMCHVAASDDSAWCDEFRDVPTPKPQPGEVLVKIRRLACAARISMCITGNTPSPNIPSPRDMRSSGEIAALGEGVAGFALGQKVTIQPQVVCGRVLALPPRQVQPVRGTESDGLPDHGGCLSLLCAGRQKVTLLPESMSLDEGAMIEPLAVAVHAVRQAGDVEGKDICVLGAGPIGILVAQVAKGLGARKVMITDVSDIRLEKAKECGADVCVNTRENDFPQAFVQCFGPDKADVIYDCAGNNVTMGQAIANAARAAPSCWWLCSPPGETMTWRC